MIWSVSTLVRRSGTARPVCVMNGSIEAVSCRSTGRRARPGGRSRRWPRRPRATPGGCARPCPGGPRSCGWRSTRCARRGELVRVHAQAHRAACRPPLGAGRGEHRVQPFGLGLGADLHGAGHDQHPDRRRDLPAAQHLGGGAQVLDPAVGARAEEDRVHGDVAQRGARASGPCRPARARRRPARPGRRTSRGRARTPPAAAPGPGWCPRSRTGSASRRPASPRGRRPRRRRWAATRQ